MGHFLKEAVNLYECSGCDINPYAIATTKERAPRATLHLGPFESAPIRVKQSAVVCWDALEHVPDLGHTLAAINKALDQDGVLLGVVPVYDGPLGWLVRRLDHDPTHVSKFSRWEWLAELERHHSKTPFLPVLSALETTSVATPEPWECHILRIEKATLASRSDLISSTTAGTCVT